MTNETIKIEPGQMWRDLDGDGTIRRGECWRNPRIIRILGHEPDDRWLAQAVTDIEGRTPTEGRGRKTKIHEATLLKGYELLPAENAAR